MSSALRVFWRAPWNNGRCSFACAEAVNIDSLSEETVPSFSIVIRGHVTEFLMEARFLLSPHPFEDIGRFFAFPLMFGGFPRCFPHAFD